MLLRYVIANNILKDVEKRILNEFMDLLILSLLRGNNKQISGYDVIKYLQVRYRFLPSPGTVYAHLYKMEREGLLKGKIQSKKRVFTLTEDGEKAAQAILQGRNKILNLISSVIQNNSHLIFQL